MAKNTLYSSKRNSTSILSTLNTLRFNENFHDVVLLVDDTRIPAQRAVLAAFSDYFRAMFESDLTESHNREIRLLNLDMTAVQALVNFCYESKIEISLDNAEALFLTASFLQIEEVKDYCREFIELNLDVDNCLDIKEMAQCHNCVELIEAATKFIQYHFVDLVADDDFLKWRVDDLEEIVALPNLRVESEYHVYDAVMQWARADPLGRSADLHRVLRHVRLPLLESELLVSLSSDDLLASNEECKDIIHEARGYASLAKGSRPKEKRWWSRPRRGKKFVSSDINVALSADVSTSTDMAVADEPHWLIYDFKEPIRLMKIDYRWSTCSAPITIQLEASNDRKHWKSLSRNTHHKGAYWKSEECRIAVPREFRYYRFYCTMSSRKNQGDGIERKWRISLFDIKMVEAVEEKVETLLFF